MPNQFKILVVDDEKELCNVLRDILSRGSKYEVVTSESVDDAIAKLEADTFALVLCDYKLGGDRTGLDVLFRAKERDPNVVTVLMTGYGTDQIAIRAVAEGVYDYLTKPFKSILDVKNVVERGIKYYELLCKYKAKEEDEALQKELLKQTLEKARRTREILRLLMAKLGSPADSLEGEHEV